MAGSVSAAVSFCILAVFIHQSHGQNNAPPEWVQSSLDTLKSIPEATPIGTVVAQLVCTDPDGDPVFYKKENAESFRVAFNGTVTLLKALNFESESDLGTDVSFACVDSMMVNGRPVPRRDQWVTIRAKYSVSDSNDNAPEFTASSAVGYFYSVPEETQVGTYLEPDITILDKDYLTPFQLQDLFFICDPAKSSPAVIATLNEDDRKTCDTFKLNHTQVRPGVFHASVSLKAPVDYETQVTYQSQLVAVDGNPGATRLTSSINILFEIGDAQDNLPEFTNLGASATVSENTPQGTTISFAVSGRDGDLGAKRPVEFEIITNNASNEIFALAPAELTDVEGVYASRLIIQKQLDRETIGNTYTFGVRVTEMRVVGNIVQPTDATATATYSVFVADVNDNGPVFDPSVYYRNVTEFSNSDILNNEKTQIASLHITCTDPDEPSNSRYRVRIVSQTFPGAYSISPAGFTFTGKGSMFLQVDDSTYLDYDVPAYRNQVVILEAKEVNTIEQFSSSATVYLTLQDVNDNAPQFPQASYNLSVSENVNTFPFPLANLSATDLDTGDNGKIVYSLEKGTPSKFSINAETGELFLQSAVDYETNQQYAFLVYATDQAEVPKSVQTQVTVNVLNFNDQGPVFRQNTYQTSANESSLSFFNPIRVQATDSEDPNARITYSIVSGQPEGSNAFYINPTTGVLELRALLDYQMTPLDSAGNRLGYFTLIVEASDNGVPPQTNRVPVTVNVIDENNHRPIVNPVVYAGIVISEIAPAGTFVAQIKGTDDDGGSFGKITYRLGPGNSGNFRVNPDSGVVSVAAGNSFNFETKPSYELFILATDGGAPQLTATATVLVDITDANNKPPVFPQFLYQSIVDETKPVGTFVLQAEAEDPDSNSQLVYSIDPDSVEANDANGNTLSINNKEGYDFKDAFAIGPNGVITVNGPLDRDIAQEIAFNILAEDINSETGPQVAETKVTIVVEGLPDENIEFEAMGISFVNENEEVGYVVTSFIATDRKTEQLISNYTALPGSSRFFNVQPAGQVVLARMIDRETDPIEHFVIVRATAEDRVRSATATLTVSILDVNDNKPIFSRDHYYAEISESARYPDLVARIEASDIDSPSFGPIQFRILGGLDSDNFMIFQPETQQSQQAVQGFYGADVLVNEGVKLNYNIRDKYELSIVAVDNPRTAVSSIRQTSVVTLTITLRAVNDHTPEFFDKSASYVIPETAGPGDNVAVIQAYDLDAKEGRNGQIVYSLERGNATTGPAAMSLFGISATGGLFVKSSLLGKGGITYTFLVRAKDRGLRPNSNTMTVQVQVLSTEDNDGNPQWISPDADAIFFAPEETPNYVLGTLRPNALPRNGTGVTYALSTFTDRYSSFAMDPATGIITILDSLDREIKERYELHIYAEDTNNPMQLRTGRTFILMLTDKDDNQPTFTNPRGYPSCPSAIDRPLVVPVNENTPANTTVYTLSACDPDAPGHNGLQYRPFNGNDLCRNLNRDSIFDVTLDGHLVTLQIVDYEQRQEYAMCVQVLANNPAGRRRKRYVNWDAAMPFQDDVAYILIQVTDVNDHGPEFPSPTAVAVMSVAPSGPVHKMDAVDKDGSQFNKIVYSIERSVFYPADNKPAVLVRGAFVLTGNALFPTESSYIEYSGGHFVLTVKATDLADSTKTDTQTLSIYVYERGQSLKLVLGLSPDNVGTQPEQLIAELDKVDSNYYFSFISTSENRHKDGVNLQRTDVCFATVDVRSERVLDISTVIGILSQRDYANVLNIGTYKVEDRGKCYSGRSSKDEVEWDSLWWILVAVAIFLFVCCIICIVAICILYKDYKRYMETRKTYLVQQ